VWRPDASPRPIVTLASSLGAIPTVVAYFALQYRAPEGRKKSICTPFGAPTPAELPALNLTVVLTALELAVQPLMEGRGRGQGTRHACSLLAVAVRDIRNIPVWPRAVT
jgi:hypothetical protein